MNQPPDFKELEKAMEAASLQERVIVVLLTLAFEYEAKAITQDRFAKRCLDTLLEYAKRKQHPAAPSESKEG